MISVKAFAKVNLLLEVKEKRPDGYHGVETLYRGISLHDDLILVKHSGGIYLECEGLAHKGLRPDASNLAWQAAQALRETYPGKVGGVFIKLVKRIPVEAGLGGGSADAAATLVGMDHLYELGLGPDKLRNLATRLGSDVPFCLAPLAAVGRGRGDILTPLEPMALGPAMWIALVKPPFGLSTKAVYDQWTLHKGADTGDGRLDRILLGMREGKAELIWDNMHNDLESMACTLDPRLAVYRDWIEEECMALVGSSGIGPPDGKVLLCGSGSAVAACFTDENRARLFAENLKSGWDRLKGRIRMIPGADDLDEQGSAGTTEHGCPQIWIARTLTAEDIAARIEEVAPYGASCRGAAGCDKPQ